MDDNTIENCTFSLLHSSNLIIAGIRNLTKTSSRTRDSHKKSRDRKTRKRTSSSRSRSSRSSSSSRSRERSSKKKKGIVEKRRAQSILSLHHPAVLDQDLVQDHPLQDLDQHLMEEKK